MLKNYFKLAARNIRKNKIFSMINIGGLAIGMAVALLIGLWIWDETTFDTGNRNYSHIAQVMQNQDLNGNIATWSGLPYPLAATLRNNYGSNFKHVVLSSGANPVLSYGEKNFIQTGLFMEPEAPELLGLEMLHGTRTGLNDPNSILLSASLAKAFFGSADPMHKIIKMDNAAAMSVTGVYADMPGNSSFANLTFIVPWQFRMNNHAWIRDMENPWGTNAFQVYVQLADHADMNKVSAIIRDVKLNNVRKEETISKPALFLHPMSKWHLYGEFKNGVNTGGRITFVWLFGIIGAFVLLLACINFMNLSTARSEKRAREVGVRKAVGSLRGQLVAQFLGESVLVAFLSFLFSMLLVQLLLPIFNTLADKKMAVPWANPLFWLAASAFTLFTGLVAGSYPAFYLSAFKPVKVLKGTFHAGKFASLPRKALVVLQFTVSIILIIGTIIVFNQIRFVKNRPVGYSRNGLLMMEMHSPAVHDHFEAVKHELTDAGAIVQMAESANPITAVWNSNGGMTWKGKTPGLSVDFPMSQVSFDYGKTAGWQIKEGRDFSKAFPSDSSAFVLNETAVKYMGLKNPIGERIAFNDGVAFTVIGVVKDFIMESPYAPVRPSLFRLARHGGNFMNMRINPSISTAEALTRIAAVIKRYDAGQPFTYKFADEEYARKFSDEERVGKLAAVFAVLAIFISCLGLFGLASFMAEQRTREIGLRKVLGASIFAVWRLLSKDFITLVIISVFIAAPTAFYFMHRWLQNYVYHTPISWWIFAAAGTGAMAITLLTVSFQAIKAAAANPVKSLRTE